MLTHYILITSLCRLSPQFLGHNLSTFLVYIWARIFEGTDVNVMDLFVTKSELLPWFFCLQTLILEGELPVADFLGIVVGHLYHYLSKRKLLGTFNPLILRSTSPSLPPNPLPLSHLTLTPPSLPPYLTLTPPSLVAPAFIKDMFNSENLRTIYAKFAEDFE